MSPKLRSHCPVNYALEAIGDRWALLIVRDIVFRGKLTFKEFLSSEEGLATNILASRLLELQRNGVLKKTRDPLDGRRIVYQLTEKGLDLIPVILEMVVWSSKYDSRSEARRIIRLIDQIRTNSRQVSKKVIELVRKGEAILPYYL